MSSGSASNSGSGPRIVNPPPRIQQPIPQRIERSAGQSSTGQGPKIVQPTPQALPSRSSGSAILVSPRQKGNPVLACLKSLPWEYSDIPADYGLGLTTGALFLSLKYHRLHPEYIYTRLRNLQGKYNLRVMLTMVDIPNHEDTLRELAKTSLVNNVTVILCWSAAEAARYLELYKSYEHASFAAIRGQQATSYAEKLVEFVTVPRSVNKADAVALVSTFGSLRAAINAEPEQISVINGWGEKKVKNWTKVINEPFRVKKAARRQVQARTGDGEAAVTALRDLDQAVPLSRVPRREMTQMSSADRESATPQPQPQPTGGAGKKPAQFQIYDPDDDDDEEAMINAAIEESKKTANPVGSSGEQLNDGVAAALAKLRETS